jgi:(p)ppGpp synthase/HD superfamily hydrolase
MLHEAGEPEAVLAAALLHDVVEDSGTSREEIADGFGEEVARLVDALSEDPRICEYEMRKQALREQVEAAGPAAVAIYAADKLSNLRDMRAAYERDGDAAARRYPVGFDVRLALWRADAEMVARAAPDLSLLRDLRYELEAFEKERSRPA